MFVYDDEENIIIKPYRRISNLHEYLINSSHVNARAKISGGDGGIFLNNWAFFFKSFFF